MADAIKESAEPLAKFTRGTLAKMVTEGWLGRVTHGIEGAIQRSFAEDEVLRPVTTRNEVQRRFRLCIEGFCLMRRDLHWAVPRILDEMPRYLRCKLDGAPWAPDEERKSWIADEEMVVRIGDPDPDEAPDVPDLSSVGIEACDDEAPEQDDPADADVV